MMQYKLVPMDQAPQSKNEEVVVSPSAKNELTDKQQSQLVEVNSVMDSVWKESEHKSKAILLYLAKNNVQYDPQSNRIVYEGGVIGSPLPDLLWWTVGSDRDDRPWDQFRFFRLLTNIAVPKSLYGPGKYKLAKATSTPYPVAVKRRHIDRDSNAVLHKQWKSLF